MKERKVAIIGAGLSGRGMLGELFFNDNFEILFVDINESLTEGLSRQKFYHVKKTNLASKQSKITKVDSFRVLNVRKERKKVVEELSEYSLICTALKPDGFAETVDYLADVIRLRIKKGKEESLKITLGANYVGLYEYYDQQFKKRFNKAELSYYENHVVLVMSIINRKNLNPIALEDMLDAYCVIGDDKPVLRVEDLAEIREMDHCPTFFQPEKNISAAMAVKIWSGNVVQCSMAFTALTKGLKNSQEASNDRDASRVAYHAAKEAYYGVFKEYNILDLDIEEKAKAAVSVFRNDKFADDLFRIAREPIRKLGYYDRFIGPARLCLKYGKIPYYITKAVAYGLTMELENEPECRKIHQIIEEKGIRQGIILLCGLNPKDTEESLLIDLIEAAWLDIQRKGF